MSRVFSFIFCVFFFLTIRDMFQARQDSSSASKSQENPNLDDPNFDFPKKQVPATRLSEIPSSDVITIKYCYSCGYKKAFEDYAQAIQKVHPSILVNGEHYNPSGGRMYLVQLISITKFAFIFIVLTGFWPAQLDAFVPAGIKAWIFNHKLYACLMAFFLSGSIESTLLSSGAFEIYYKGKQTKNHILSLTIAHY